MSDYFVGLYSKIHLKFHLNLIIFGEKIYTICDSVLVSWILLTPHSKYLPKNEFTVSSRITHLVTRHCHLVADILCQHVVWKHSQETSRFMCDFAWSAIISGVCFVWIITYINSFIYYKILHTESIKHIMFKV